MKKIIMSLGTLVFAAAVVVGGTGALFVDSETSTGNVFTAGSVQLGINSITHDYLSDGEPEGGNDPTGYTDNGVTFNFADLKPRDFGTVTFDVENLENDAYLCARVIEEGNAENDRLDQETQNGDGTPNIGELQNFLNFRFDGEVGSLADADGIWTELLPNSVPGGTSVPASFEYCFGDFNGSACETDINDLTINQAQTDSVTATVEFYAVQSRNNDGFECDSLNEEEPEEVDGLAGSSWAPITSAWQADIRWGNNQSEQGDWELAIKENGPATPWDQAGKAWGASPYSGSFELDYDGTTATLSVDGTVVSTTQVSGANGKIGLNLKTNDADGDDGVVSVSNVQLNGVTPTGDDSQSAQGVDPSTRGLSYLVLDGVSGPFTLTGDFTFEWGSNPDEEGPSISIGVEDTI